MKIQKNNIFIGIYPCLYFDSHSPVLQYMEPTISDVSLDCPTRDIKTSAVKFACVVWFFSS